VNVTAVVELENITFRRGDRVILDGLSWAIERGEHWAMLGANGSGKTTLLKIITGYAWATSGTVKLLGQQFGQCDVRESRKAIGWVSSALQERLPNRDTAAEIVLSGFEASVGLYRRFRAAELSQARKWLGLLGCESLAEQRYGTLSQGEQQRVIIARALVHAPAVLILDEPCVGLDPAARQSFLDDLTRLAGQVGSPSMILVTHHIEEIGPWIEHILLLKEGRCLGQGAKWEMLTEPLLSEAFGRTAQVAKNGGYYRLELQ